jgi:MFS family permease
LRSEFRGLATVFGLLYFIQSLIEPTEGLLAQPMRSLLKSNGYDTAAIGLFGTVISLPWVLKPIYGLISDFVPFLGMRRRSYLLATLGVTALSLEFLAVLLGISIPLPVLTLAVIVPTAAVAFSDVVVDAVMIEEGNRRGWTGRLQSVQWAASSAGGLLTGIAGGWISEHAAEQYAVTSCSMATVIALIVAWLAVPEPPKPAALRRGEMTFGKAVRSLWKAIDSPETLRIALFLAVWNFNPFASNVLQTHMETEWGWSRFFYGETVSWHAGGAILGSVIYPPLSRRAAGRKLYVLSIATGALSTALYLLIATENSARAISFCAGIAYMFGTLAQLDLAARSCAPQTAATTFAILMSVANAGMAFSSSVGGYLYEAWRNSVGANIAYSRLIILGAGTTLGCLILVPWRSPPHPPADEPDQGPT